MISMTLLHSEMFFVHDTAVCNSIRDPVTTDRLLEFIERHRWTQSDQDLMPPPSKVPRRWIPVHEAPTTEASSTEVALFWA